MSKLATLLVSKINYCIVNYTSRLGKAAGDTCICCWELSHRRLRPHKSIRSHTCALPLISAECKRLDIHLAEDWWERRRREGLNYVSLGVRLLAKSNGCTINIQSGEAWERNCSKCYMACVIVRFSNLKMLVCNSAPCRFNTRLSTVIGLHKALNNFLFYFTLENANFIITLSMPQTQCTRLA